MGTKKKIVKKKVLKNKGGRPKKKLDFKAIDNLCAIQCTGEEVAAFLDIDYDTLNNGIKRIKNIGFSEYFALKSGKGKVSLRRKQYQLAMSGDKTMLIWLGKQYLDQAEKHETKNTNYNKNYEDLPDEEIDNELKKHGYTQ